MRIMVIRGNPRKNGFTQNITDLVVQGAADAGAEISDIDLSKKNVKTCVGCYRCWTDTPGKCFQNDEMNDLLDCILNTDILLCSTPLYYYTMSSAMKIFLERTLPLFKQTIKQNTQGLYINNLRYPEKWQPKGFAIVSAGAFKGVENFKGLISTFRLIAEGMQMTFCGALVRPESYLLQFTLAKPKTVKIIETALRKAGMELATKGSVSKKTEGQISTPLTIDHFHFMKYSNIYWEHIISLGMEGSDLEKIRQVVTSDVRILMHEMARSIDPKATTNLKAILQFDFPDKDLHYCISVTRGTCTMEEKESEKFDLRVTVDSVTWAKAFIREISMKDALMQRKIKLEGDKTLFTRLDRYFPPPVI